MARAGNIVENDDPETSNTFMQIHAHQTRCQQCSTNTLQSLENHIEY